MKARLQSRWWLHSRPPAKTVSHQRQLKGYFFPSKNKTLTSSILFNVCRRSNVNTRSKRSFFQVAAQFPLILLFLSSASTTSSLCAQKQSPTSCTATGPTHWWRATSSAYTSTFSLTAPTDRWCLWTRPTIHSPSSSSSRFCSPWPWSPSWSGVARGAISWPENPSGWKRLDSISLRLSTQSFTAILACAVKYITGTSGWLVGLGIKTGNSYKREAELCWVSR